MKYAVSIFVAVVLVGGVYLYQKSNTGIAASSVQDVASATQAVAPVPTATTTDVTSPTDVTVSGGYTLSEVAKHADRTSCWSAINGAVYDLTTWIDKHPGGAKRILSICGKDGTSAFTNQHEGAPKQEAMLASFKLGDLE